MKFQSTSIGSSVNLSASAWHVASIANRHTMFALAPGVLATAGYFVAVAVTTLHMTAPNAASILGRRSTARTGRRVSRK
ncbi:hypothetical protein [Diaminobutyricibacter sp. McL0608]|uniref:hypothetical protein n=1 Tax=Leifsonia sp. McL0608 TaxID=3143537 RepID=UPI0031F31D77